MKRLPQLIALVFLLWMAHAPGTLGCPSHYISREVLVRESRLILEIQVTSVSDAPPQQAGFPGDPSERSQAVAKVQVLNVLKGDCPAREFTVVGGPYGSCAPTPSYLHFEVGSKMHLVLDAPVPAGVDTIVITAAGRVMEARSDEMQALIRKAGATWQAAVDRHQRAAPAAMETARQLLGDAGPAFANVEVANQPFDVLSCLRILMNDPAHLPPPEPRPARDDGGIGVFRARQPAATNVWVTSEFTDTFMPKAMAEIFEQRAKSHPEEVKAFNLALLMTLLRDELLVPERFISALPTEPALADLSHIRSDPTWCSFPGRRDAAGLVVPSLNALLMLAAPEPDYLVFGRFGSPSQLTLQFVPEVFLPWLRRGGPPDLEERYGALGVLLQISHPEVAEILRRSMKSGEFRIVPFFEYFAGMGMMDDLAYIVSHLESKISQEAKTRPVENKDPYAWNPWSNYAEEIRDIQKEIEERKLDVADLSKRLTALADQVSKQK